MRLLLSRDDVVADSHDTKGRTPLFWAAERGNEAVVRLLLSRDDVAVASPDVSGWTPLELAKESKHNQVVRLLEQKMREANLRPRDVAIGWGVNYWLDHWEV